MNPPSGPTLRFEELKSTQTYAADLVRKGEIPGIIFADHQSHGRGRFDRQWLSERGDSFTATFVFDQYQNHPFPWLVGMSVALAAAASNQLQLQWPNDLTLSGKKVGGILTELVTAPNGSKFPLVGIGINLNQKSFEPEIADRATSLRMASGNSHDPEAILQSLLTSISNVPEPDSWESIEPAWMLFDETPGKQYKLFNGTVAQALGIGPNGQLICSIAGETHSILAADAIFGEDGFLHL